MNSMPKYVVSTKLDKPEWNNSKVIKENVADSVAELRRAPGGAILVNGSGQLVQTLTQHQLVDEYRLMIFPVVLGRGKRLFPSGSDRAALRLVETKPAGECVILICQPA
jgi:dihydrofolate reductase